MKALQIALLIAIVSIGVTFVQAQSEDMDVMNDNMDASEGSMMDDCTDPAICDDSESTQYRTMESTEELEMCGDVPCLEEVTGQRGDPPIVHDVSSPVKQLKSGVSPEDIKCKPQFRLIYKQSDNTPACVTYETAKILDQRGYAVVLIHSFEQCRDAGYDVMESNPPQCMTSDGAHFTQAMTNP